MSSAEKPLGRRNRLAHVVNELCKSEHGMLSWLGRGGRVLPSRDQVIEAAEALRSVLFPGYVGISELTEENMRFHVGATLDRVVGALQEQISLPEGSLHTGQEVEQLGRIREGEELTLSGRIAQRSERQGFVISVIEFEISGGDGAAVRARTTIMAPAAVA